MKPSDFLDQFLSNQISIFDNCSWMSWSKESSTSGDGDEPRLVNESRITLRKNYGSVEDLSDELDSSWNVFLKHCFITRVQSDYVKFIKEAANENDTIVIHIDFAENYTLIAQREIMQAHWTNRQASIFTTQIIATKAQRHSLVIISDSLSHDVLFVHAAQRIIADYILNLYPKVKQLNYISDGAPQHFKNNKNLLNLTYHKADFGVPASWTFTATAHGKGAVDGIGAAVKYRATKHVLSVDPHIDSIRTAEDLFKFTQKNSSMIVFYLDHSGIVNNARNFQLENRWKDNKSDGW